MTTQDRVLGRLGDVVLRLARPDDAEALGRWDEAPHVIAATTDDPAAATAFADISWAEEISDPSPIAAYFIAEAQGRAIGAMQIIDPHLEPTHYWGEIELGLRALDIWIGEADALGRGYGRRMMRIALRFCFDDAGVHAVVIDPLASNARAHAFYRRLGFVPEERRRFGDDADDCLVHRLRREDWRARLPGDARLVVQPPNILFRNS